jgi:hypothetical protein
MTRLGSLIVCITLGTGLAACGSNNSSGGTSKDALDLVPLDDDVSGWTVDEAHSKTPGERAMVANTHTEAVELIDGTAADFYLSPYTPTKFLWQNYKNGSLPSAPPEPPDNPDGALIKLFILQMPSAEQACGLYTAILGQSNYTTRQGTAYDWQDPTTPPLGAHSRIQDRGSQWWINFCQDVYYIEVLLKPSYGPPPDYDIGNVDNKNETFRFAREISSKI